MDNFYIKDIANKQVFYEFAPSIVFLIANFYGDLFTATIWLIGATVFFSLWSFVTDKKIPVFPLLTLILVLLLGTATLLFNESSFIKMKPTIGKVLFAAMIGCGIFMQKGLLQRAFENLFTLPNKQAWNLLTYRWITVILVFALLNEFVWRTMSTDTWVLWKTLDTPISIVILINLTRRTVKHVYRNQKKFD